MGLPRTLKHMMLFLNGVAYAGEVKSVSLPKLTRKLEGYRGGGMDSTVKVDLGAGEDLELEFTAGGVMEEVLDQFGGTLTGTLIRFVGTFEADDSGQMSTVEVTVRGRFEELDMGDGKPGELTEQKFKLACAYYQLTVDGREKVHVEPLNFVFRVNGVDRLERHRSALGL